MTNATIDIGTNSVLLLVAGRSPFKIIRDEARITGLGRGLSETFHPESKQRTVAALEEYDQLCREAKVAKVVCVGTAAFRKAQDGPEFMREIGVRFGWEARIITGEEEARLSYLSVEHDFGKKFSNLVALDIGGGSTEIIGLRSRGLRSKGREGQDALLCKSLLLGTVSLTENLFKHDPPLNSEIEVVENAIEQTLRSLSLKPYTLNLAPALIALAGTATTLSSVNQKLPKWDPKKIQGSMIAVPELDAMIELFRKTMHLERRKIPGMIPGREDTILAGSLILRAVMKKLRTERAIASDRGLRYGLFYQEFS